MNKEVAPMGALDKDLQDKMNAKFDKGKMDQARAWIESVHGTAFPGDTVDDFLAHLKSGVVLCEMINKIKAKSVKKVKDSKMPFVQRENIVNYLEGSKKLGLKETDCFVTQDLFEGDNAGAVVDQLFSLGAASRDVADFQGPYLGVKFAKENVREFSEEVIVAGKCIHSQQTAGSVAVEKEKGTDSIVSYGKVGQEMGKSVGGVTQQTAGSIAVEKEKGTDSIVQYGKVGQEMGKASGEISQQNAGSVDTGRQGNIDMITRGMN